MQRRMLYTQEKKKKQIPSCKKNLPIPRASSLGKGRNEKETDK